MIKKNMGTLNDTNLLNDMDIEDEEKVSYLKAIANNVNLSLDKLLNLNNIPSMFASDKF